MAAVWVSGELVPEDEATVSVFDHGLLTGDGVFETLRTYRGRPFAVRRHLERLARSALGLGLSIPETEVLRSGLLEVVDASGLDAARVRITVTAGPSPLGSERGDTEPTVIIAAAPATEWPPTADVVVAPWPKNERGALAGLKTTSYAENVVALAWARARGAHEAVVANLAGNLCEGTGTNVFVGAAGRLLTPPLSSGCLAGVTRALLVEMGLAFEQEMPVEALAHADEAFLTSSTRGVQPIATVDGRALAGAPGPLTGNAASAFEALVERDLDP